MKRSEMITKKDFIIRGYWKRGMLRGQENDFRYEIIIGKGAKKGQTFADGFTSKRKAEQWLGVRIRIANDMRRGKTFTVKGKPYNDGRVLAYNSVGIDYDELKKVSML